MQMRLTSLQRIGPFAQYAAVAEELSKGLVNRRKMLKAYCQASILDGCVGLRGRASGLKSPFDLCPF